MTDQKPQGRGPLPVKFPHEPERYQKAAELIVRMRRGEIELQGEEGFPEDARPRNRDEAQIIADLVIPLLGRPVLGWKFYINATIQQAPLRTPIYDIWESPAKLPPGTSQHYWIEPELAFRAARDFAPQDEAYSYEEILAGFEAVPVFEIIGPRFRFDSAAHMRQVVNGYRVNPRFDGLADNNASGGYVVGKPVTDWQRLDWLKLHVTMAAGGETLVDTVGGHPLVDPFISMFPLVNMMRLREGLKAGMLMATHSYSGFIPVPPDEKVVSTFTGFDDIEATFERGPRRMPFGQVRDIQVYYEIVGAGPRLLLLNGTGADLRRKQPWVDRLNDHFTVLRFDQRGLGQTDKPDRHYSMADYADDAAALLDLVGWDRAAVLGVSFGGSVAQELARRHPARITRLALACANPGGPFGYPLLALHHQDTETRARTMLELDLRKTKAWQAANPDKTRELIAQGMARGADRDPVAAMGARRQLEAREEHDAREWIGEIAVPTGLFGGRYDGLGTEAGQRFMQERIAGSELQLFEGAHMFLGEDPAAVPAVVAFLTRAG